MISILTLSLRRHYGDVGKTYQAPSMNQGMEGRRHPGTYQVVHVVVYVVCTKQTCFTHWHISTETHTDRKTEGIAELLTMAETSARGGTRANFYGDQDH